DDNNIETGFYSVSLAFATPRCGVPLACGQTVTNTLRQGGQVDTYSFSGGAGEVVRLTPSPSLCGYAFVVLAELFGPSGAPLGSFGCSGPSTVKLPTNGTYTVFVHDDNNIETGFYSVSLDF